MGSLGSAGKNFECWSFADDTELLRSLRTRGFQALRWLSDWNQAHRPRAENGLVQTFDPLRRPRHGRRSRHRQYARLRQGARHRALGAFCGGDRFAQRPRPRGRRRSEADAGSHAGNDHRDPAAEGRCHRRLRGDRADAPSLHHLRLQPLRPPAGRRLRSLRGDRGREACGGGGLSLGGRPPGLPDRGADGGGDRRRSSGGRADRFDDRRRRRRHHRGGGDQPRRDRRLSRSGSAATSSTKRSSVIANGSTNSRSAPRRPRKSSSSSARLHRCRRRCGRRFAAAT
jgi:hypothetical protein